MRQAYGIAILKGIYHKGTNVIIHGPGTFIGKKQLVIGDHVRIGNNAYFNALGGINIGCNTQISRNVTIYSANHKYDGRAIPYDDTYNMKKVSIGESVWIGMNVMILPGVTIGNGAIIGMGTVVTKDVEPGAIVVGASMRKIGTRDMEEFINLKMKDKHFAKLYPKL
ncbi:acyltransferase [Pontibacter pudoricolor]|uniref:acyltransferase n=1 Tax=Pontibacter pudoricolor TaxID=2694930 RepID=UPI001391FEF2|nr:acyltransferase [Pontibacter pudoricolor]